MKHQSRVFKRHFVRKTSYGINHLENCVKFLDFFKTNKRESLNIPFRKSFVNYYLKYLTLKQNLKPRLLKQPQIYKIFKHLYTSLTIKCSLKL